MPITGKDLSNDFEIELNLPPNEASLDNHVVTQYFEEEEKGSDRE